MATFHFGAQVNACYSPADATTLVLTALVKALSGDLDVIAYIQRKELEYY